MYSYSTKITLFPTLLSVIISFISFTIFLLGTMEDIVTRFLENIVGRLDGPMHLRFIFQPIMATIFACIGGWHDAKQDRPIYFWSIFSGKTTFREVRKAAWDGVAKVFIVALILDIIYQIIVLKWVYPGETIVVATLLVFVPYLILRGPVSQLCKMFIKTRS